MGIAGVSAMTVAAQERHRLYEDVLALSAGSIFVSLGVAMYAKAELLVGGTAGVALLAQYTSGLSFGLVFSAINLPFYWLALRRLGWRFALRSFAAVSLVSLLTKLMPGLVDFAHLDPLYATIAGGALTGTGMLMLFRHRASLGGINILAVYLQDSYGIRAGYFQLAVDLAILAAAFFVLAPQNIVLSVVGAGVVNLVIAINHKPGRYMGVS